MDSKKCHELKQMVNSRVSVIPYVADHHKLLEALKAENCDTMFLIPPAHKDKFVILKAVIECAAKLKSVRNVILLSSAGCDVAERNKQPSIREFIDMETLLMQQKSEPATGSTGHSPCIIKCEISQS